VSDIGVDILLVVVPESPLESTKHGLVPTGKGWFILNARDAPWYERNGRGFYCEFEGLEEQEPDFSQLGINIQVLRPGEPMSMYHWEADQEDFLVVAGEAVAIVEGEERPLRRWDLLHCPPETKHVIVGAGEGPCIVVAVGARDRSTGAPEREGWGGYTVDEAAGRHGASVDEDTTVPKEAYARFAPSKVTSYPEGLLPEG
jgi:mannose-6-phosphate isomerase-like protein (cupin superfamily)